MEKNNHGSKVTGLIEVYSIWQYAVMDILLSTGNVMVLIPVAFYESVEHICLKQSHWDFDDALLMGEVALSCINY